MKNMIHDVQVGNVPLSTTNNQVYANTSWLGRTLTVALLLLTLGVGQMWGASEGSNWYDASSAKVYFDNTNSSYTNVSMLIGRKWNYGGVGDAGSWGINFSKVSGTNNLYYASVSATKYTTFAFINASNWSWETNKVTDRLAYATNTDTPNDNLSSNSHLYTPASSSDGTSVTHTSLSSYNTLNYTQTVYRYVSENGGTPAASTANIATISIATKYLSSANATSNHNVSISSGSSSANTTAARTATVTMTATSIAEGYTFLGWYSAGTGGTLLESSTTYTYQATAAKSVYARFSHETTHSVSITYTCASPSATVSTATSQAIGQVTASSITAPTVIGYTFTGWTVGNGLEIQSGYTTSSNPISVKTKSSGPYTLQANYAEDLSSTWIVAGGNKIVTTGNTWRTSVDANNMMTKKTGHSTESVVYYSVITTGTNLGNTNGDYKFKIVNTANNSTTWYGLTANDQYYMIRDMSGTEYELSTSGADIELRADVAGTYEIKVDYSGSTPKITVTFPTSYTVTYGVAPSGAAAAVTTSPSVTSGGKVLTGTSVTFTRKTPNTGFAWKGWYNNAAGTGTALGTGNTYTKSINENTDLYAVYTENAYNVTVSAGANGTVSPSGTVSVKQVSGTDLTATPNAGYAFNNWTKSGSNITLTSTTTNPTTAKATSAGGSVTANFVEDWYIYGDKAVMGSWATEWTSGKLTADGDNFSITLNLAANTTYQFKLYKKSGSNHYWSNSTDISGKTKSASNVALYYDDNTNMSITTAIAGAYKFTLSDVSSANPKLAIDFPSALQIYRSTPTHSAVIATHAWDSQSGSVYRKTLELNGNTTYEFKIYDGGEYYTHSTKITTSISNRNFSNSGSDCQLETKSAGSFIFDWDRSSKALTVHYPQSAIVESTPDKVYSGSTVTFTGYASELGSGSHTVKYEFFKGTSLTAANKVAEKTKTETATHQQVTTDPVTITFDGNTTSQVYTLRVTSDGVERGTNTCTVYRKWDIYVHDVASWNAMYYYVYNADGSHRDTWPGQNYSDSKYNGNATWYSVALDAQYPYFILDNNAGNKQTKGDRVYATSITTFTPGSFWYVAQDDAYTSSKNDGKTYYNLTQVNLTDPTVTLDAPEVVSGTMAYFTGTVTNFGNDGMSAAEMREVGVYIGDTKYTTTCYGTGANTAKFYIVVDGLTAGTTYSACAFALNAHGEGKSAAQSFTTRAHDTYTIKVRSTSTPYVYAWSYKADPNGCGAKTEENGTWPGIAMTSTGITGVQGTWYEFTMDNNYNQFKVTSGANAEAYTANQTDDWAAPGEDKCYWYWNGTERATQSERLGVMACPILEPTLMIESTAGSGSYTNYTMTTNGSNVEYTLSLEQEVTYRFKVIYNADYYTRSNSEDIFTGNHNSNIAFSVLDGSGNEGELQTTVAGSYKISFNTSTKKVTVTYPQIPTLTSLTVTAVESLPTAFAPFAGNGTSENPYMIFKDKGINLRAVVAPTTNSDHIYIKFGDTEKTAGAPKQNLTAAPNDLIKHTITIEAYYKYNGIEGTKQTKTIYYQAIEVPTLTLTAAATDYGTDVEMGHTTTLTATVTNGDGTESGNIYFYYVQAPGVNDWKTKESNSRSGSTITTAALSQQGVYNYMASMLYHGREIFSDPISVNSYKVVTVKVGVMSNTGWGNLKFHWWTSAKSAVNTQSDYITNLGGTKWYALTFRQPYPISFVLYDGTGESGNDISYSPDSERWHQAQDVTNVNADVCYIIDGNKFGEYGTDQYKKLPQLKNDCSGFYRVHVRQPLFNELGEANGNSWDYYSNIVTGADSVSYYVCHNATVYELQEFGNGGWVRKQDLSGSKPAQSDGVKQLEAIKYSDNDHVYHAYFNGTTLTGITKYSGNFYVRSNLANGWDDYITSNSKMTHFGPLVTYDHYWVTFTGDNVAKNIDVQVGDAINPELTRNPAGDVASLTETIDGISRAVKAKNVRYSYNSFTNWLDVAVIGASTETSYVFLSAFGADASGTTASTKVFLTTGANNAKGTATREDLAASQKKFIDLSNWYYQADLYIVKPAGTAESDNVMIGVQARLPHTSTVQEIVSREKPLEVLGNTTTGGNYIVRVIYHYPTNTLLAGWLPANTENVTTNKVIEGNMILNRVENDGVQQIKLSDGMRVTGLHKIYMGLEMQKNNASGEFYKVHGSEGTKNITTNVYYWFSLPYDSDIDSIIGLPGTYGEDWGILTYDGKLRSEKGMFADSDTYWKWLKLEVPETTLKAYEGYVLAVDLKKSDFKPVTIDGKTYASIFAYFPANEAGYNLENKTNTVTYETYECTIPSRMNRDSGWRLMGVPGYSNVAPASFSGPNPIDTDRPTADAFYYEYVYSDGIGNQDGTDGSSAHNQYKYHTTKTDTYKAFHAYFVQYNGSITWAQATDNVKAAIRRKVVTAGGKELQPATLRMTISRNDVELDNTYIRLDADLSADYVVNEDLGKVINKKATNIYTICQEANLGANCLPLDEQEVPLGMRIAVAGDYVLAFDNVPQGMTAILVDQETGLETDLALDSYEVSLEKGTIDSRFYVRLAPAQTDIATDLSANGQAGVGTLTATLSDGKLLLSGISDEGADISVFDAAGRLVYDRRTYRGEVIDLPATSGVFLVRSGQQVIRVVK